MLKLNMSALVFALLLACLTSVTAVPASGTKTLKPRHWPFPLPPAPTAPDLSQQPGAKNWKIGEGCYEAAEHHYFQTCEMRCTCGWIDCAKCQPLSDAEPGLLPGQSRDDVLGIGVEAVKKRGAEQLEQLTKTLGKRMSPADLKKLEVEASPAVPSRPVTTFVSTFVVDETYPVTVGDNAHNPIVTHTEGAVVESTYPVHVRYPVTIRSVATAPPPSPTASKEQESGDIFTPPVGGYASLTEVGDILSSPTSIADPMDAPNIPSLNAYPRNPTVAFLTNLRNTLARERRVDLLGWAAYDEGDDYVMDVHRAVQELDDFIHSFDHITGELQGQDEELYSSSPQDERKWELIGPTPPPLPDYDGDGEVGKRVVLERRDDSALHEKLEEHEDASSHPVAACGSLVEAEDTLPVPTSTTVPAPMSSATHEKQESGDIYSSPVAAHIGHYSDTAQFSLPFGRTVPLDSFPMTPTLSFLGDLRRALNVEAWMTDSVIYLHQNLTRNIQDADHVLDDFTEKLGLIYSELEGANFVHPGPNKDCVWVMAPGPFMQSEDDPHEKKRKSVALKRRGDPALDEDDFNKPDGCNTM